MKGKQQRKVEQATNEKNIKQFKIDVSLREKGEGKTEKLFEEIVVKIFLQFMEMINPQV